MTTRSHFEGDAEALEKQRDAEALEKQLAGRKSIKLKYYRLRKAVRAKRNAELKELEHKEFLERWALPRLSIPKWYWDVYD